MPVKIAGRVIRIWRNYSRFVFDSLLISHRILPAFPLRRLRNVVLPNLLNVWYTRLGIEPGELIPRFFFHWVVPLQFNGAAKVVKLLSGTPRRNASCTKKHSQNVDGYIYANVTDGGFDGFTHIKLVRGGCVSGWMTPGGS